MDTLPQAVLFGEGLAYQNVVSYRAKFHYSKLGEYAEAFAADVVKLGGTVKGPYFYSLNNVPMDEVTDIEFFLPIQQSAFEAVEGMRFHSYYSLSPLALGTVIGDIETNTEYVYALLLASLERRGLEVNAPFFHVLPEDRSPYVSVYLGYADPLEMDA